MTNEWTDDLSTEIEWINDQHKELFERIYLLSLAFEGGKGKEEIIYTLKFLQDYIIVHFKDEEDLQIKYNYPHYLSHKELHKEFVNDFNKFKYQVINQGISSNLAYEVKQKLTEWLKKHINIVDRAMAEHMVKHLETIASQ